MDGSYHPKDPQAKLREVAVKWGASMRVAGHGPNRDVAFGGDGPAAEDVRAHGWLVDDWRPGADGSGYLVMENGDVWHAGASPALDRAVDAWLTEPNDDLVMLFARALRDAQVGGSGWLEDGDGVVRVPDRRREQHPHEGPERRGA